MKSDLKPFAVELANYIGENHFQPHRGVTIACAAGGDQWLIAFGNDAYEGDPRTKRYADALLRCLKKKYGRAELGVDTTEERYTWVVAVPVKKGRSATAMIEPTEAILYREYCRSRGLAEDDGFVWCRAEICRREIGEHFPEGCILIDDQ